MPLQAPDALSMKVNRTHLVGAQVRHAHFDRGLRLARAPGLALGGAGSIDVPLQAMQSIAHHIGAAVQLPKLGLQKGHLLAESVVGRRLHGQHSMS